MVLFFFFFWQYWELNQGSCACLVSALPLEPYAQFFCLCVSLFLWFMIESHWVLCLSRLLTRELPVSASQVAGIMAYATMSSQEQCFQLFSEMLTHSKPYGIRITKLISLSISDFTSFLIERPSRLRSQNRQSGSTIVTGIHSANGFPSLANSWMILVLFPLKENLAGPPSLYMPGP
jgi:hypothetical protein